MTAQPLSWIDDSPRDVARWAMAAALVVGVHAGAITYLLATHQPDVIGDVGGVVTVELAPVDSARDATERDVAPAPETMVESQPLPDLPEPKQEEMKVEQPPDQAPALVPLPEAKPPEKVDESPPPAPRTAQQVKGGAPAVPSSYKSEVVRQIHRFKQYPRQAKAHNEEATVLVTFSLDRNGHVLAHSIAHSSGYAALDDEAIAMIVRADPFPPFPASMPQARQEFTAPIRFSLN